MKEIIPKKLVLNGTDNNGKRHRYSFDKTPNLKGGLRKLLISLDFDKKIVEGFIRGVFFKEIKEEEIIEQELENIIDIVYFLKNDKYELDIFFGKEKVILLARTTDKREKLIDALEKKTKWIPEEEKERRLKFNESKLKAIGKDK